MSLKAFLDALTPSCRAVKISNTTNKYYTDHRDKRVIPSQDIAFANSTQQVSQIIRYCNEQRIPVIPQGGNTGLVGASIPQSSATGLILNLDNMKAMRHFDDKAGLMTVEAGMTLAVARRHAQDRNMVFPLYIAPEDRCTIGGNLASNAGGMEAHRYGCIRRSCLGVEFVCADGSIIDRRSPLQKNNAGYDLSQLVIGSEGTLAVITAATFRLFPLADGHHRCTFWFNDFADPLEMATTLRNSSNVTLRYAEIMHKHSFTVLDASPYFKAKWPTGAMWALLLDIETSDGETHADATSTLFDVVKAKSVYYDESSVTSENFMQVRTHHSILQADYGHAYKFDLALPLDCIAAFMNHALNTVSQLSASLIPVPFGHLCDGNIHFDILDRNTSPQKEKHIRQVIEDLTLQYGGTFAAEHGIGRHRNRLQRLRSAEDIAVMKRVRNAFDPNGILNPGVLF